jgi:glycosyltransferase involved in cell wall biosynthesis
VPHETFLEIPNSSKTWFENLPRPVILTVGQLIARKGVDKLIEACGRLALRGAKFTLAIVGQGPERERLEELARANDIDSFFILPNQSQSVLNEIYRAADVFVFPTMEDVWGLVVNEAMWAGLPVLCSEYAGCAAELLPETNVFDPLSPQSFDVALARALDGTVALPDRSRLRTWQEVAAMIDRSIKSGSPVSE